MKRIFPAAFGCCLFLIILGAKWAVFDRYGSAMPDWDQWDAEGSELLIPWFEGGPFLEHLFAPHNEHRVVFTKLQTLALTLANGQWDSRLLAVVNAILHSAIGAALWLVGTRWLAQGARKREQGPGHEGCGERRREKGEGGSSNFVASRLGAAGLFILTAALFALPFAWQNTLGGFHSQQYWLLALSLAAVLALPFARPWSGGWWVAVLTAALALLTMASGLLASAVVFALLMLRAARGETSWRDARPTLIACAALVITGLAMHVEVPGHGGIRAQSFADFFLTIVRSLAWPLRGQDWPGLVFWSPWAIVAWRAFVRAPPTGNPRPPQLIAALGGWVLLQVLATAYARGLGGEYPASRYMDTLAIGAFANGAAVAWLAGSRPSARKATAGLALAWVTLLGIGLYRETADTFVHHLPGAKNYYVDAERHLRGYLATRDPAHLAFPEIPYPHADALAERLDHPHLQPLMPAVVRAPLPLEPAGRSSARQSGSSVARAERAEPECAFLENEALSPEPRVRPNRGLSPRTMPLHYAKTWGSYGSAGTAATGEWRSAPLSAPLHAWLKFETAGHVGDAGTTLELRDAATDAVVATVRPSRLPGDSWRAAYVRAPRKAFVVVARDTDSSKWMAFSAPVEVGALSYRAWRVSRHGMLILTCAASGAVLLAAAAVWTHRAGFGLRSGPSHAT